MGKKLDVALTEKQRRFVEAYSGNAKEAARLAGYDGDDAVLAQIGHENLRKPNIVEAIRSHGDAERSARIATRIQRQAFWTELMLNQNADDAARLRASELLGKSECDFIDRHELSGPGGKPVEVSRADLSDEEIEAKIKAMLGQK